jgi:type I restriction enzyme, S subunit
MSGETALEEFCETGSGSTPSRAKLAEYYGGGIPWVKSGELREGTVTSTEESVTKAGAQAARLKLVPKGSLLVAMYGATVGRTALLGVDATTNQAVCHVRPDPSRADTRYVWFALQAKLPELLARRVGGAQPNISQETIRTTKIWLPPLPEQRRIADILDKADAIRRKRKETVALTEELLRSTFLEMFGDPVTNPKRLEKQPLGALVDVKSGEFLPAKAMGVGGQFAVYGGNGVNGRHTEFMFEEPRIVIGRVGVYCGAVHRTEPRSWVTDNALYVSRLDQALLPSYLEHALRFANLNKYASQSAQPLISGGRIYPVEILVPTVEAQRCFEKAERAQQRLRGHAGEGLDVANALFDALVHRAFRGELTMNGSGRMQLGMFDSGDR